MCPHALTHSGERVHSYKWRFTWQTRGPQKAPLSRVSCSLKRLEGDLSTIGSSWQGAASVQFSSLMAQWQENAAKVNQALQDLADNLRATDSSMEANESETENSFAQLLGGL